MVKVGILTFYDVMNYGASLQAYALMKTVKDLGTNCEIIQYRSEGLKRTHTIRIVDGDVKKCVRSLMIRTALIRIFTNYKEKIKYLKIRSAYNRFNKGSYWMSKPAICSEDINNLKYDLVLAGSDQIWNPKNTKGFDDVFFGKGINSYMATYAASGYDFRSDELQNNTFLSLLQYPQKISVREDTLHDFLSRNHIASTHVLDPTLIADPKVFDDIAICPKTTEPYLLVYYLGKFELLDLIIQDVSRALGMKILMIKGRESDVEFKGQTIEVSGPKEFLGLIKRANFVITNSFHGVAFSIIYRKPFISFLFNNPDRISSLLRKLQLTSKIITETNYDLVMKIINEKINWDAVDELLMEERKKSLAYLQSVIDCVEVRC